MFTGKAPVARDPNAHDHADRVRAVAEAKAVSGQDPFAASWRRSLINHRIDPATGADCMRLEQATIRARREASGRLLSVAAPILDRLARAAGEAGCTVLLTDAAGLILEERVRAGDRAYFTGTGLVQGADWSERREGTNGIGTCVAEARPVIVHRDQHFHARNTLLSCTASPIIN